MADSRVVTAACLSFFPGLYLPAGQYLDWPSARRNQPTAKASSSNAAVSATDIAAAKASHKVWVNLDSGVYHKGGRWYGKTKNGKFMTEDEANKAGYKPAKRD